MRIIRWDDPDLLKLEAAVSGVDAVTAEDIWTPRHPLVLKVASSYRSFDTSPEETRFRMASSRHRLRCKGRRIR
jgi:hypothetical protein